VEKREQRGDKWQMMMLGNCCALFPVSDLVLVGGKCNDDLKVLCVPNFILRREAMHWKKFTRDLL